MINPMLVRSLTLVATPVLNSPRAEAHQVSFPSADLPLTDGATSRLLFPPRPAFHEGPSARCRRSSSAPPRAGRWRTTGPMARARSAGDSGGC